MTIRLLGDVPQWQKDLAVELRTMEKSLDGMIDFFPGMQKAKCYVSLAHDWYYMGADEEGQKLLVKANEVCPGYFKNEINDHMKQSPEFTKLVNNLALELRSILLQSIKK